MNTYEIYYMNDTNLKAKIGFKAKRLEIRNNCFVFLDRSDDIIKVIPFNNVATINKI